MMLFAILFLAFALLAALLGLAGTSAEAELLAMVIYFFFLIVAAIALVASYRVKGNWHEYTDVATRGYSARGVRKQRQPAHPKRHRARSPAAPPT